MVHALFVVEQAGPSGHRDSAVEKREATGEEVLDAIVALGDERGVFDTDRFTEFGKSHV